MAYVQLYSSQQMSETINCPLDAHWLHILLAQVGTTCTFKEGTSLYKRSPGYSEHRKQVCAHAALMPGGRAQ